MPAIFKLCMVYNLLFWAEAKQHLVEQDMFTAATADAHDRRFDGDNGHVASKKSGPLLSHKG